MAYELNQESYSKSEVEALLQSETDKVRTQYSQKLKAAEKERDALKPAVKTEAEIALDARAAELSKRERVFACKEAGIDIAFADMLAPDADLSKLSELLNKAGAYVPGSKNKDTGGSMTKEQFAALPYSKQAKIYAENPELAKSLIGY